MSASVSKQQVSPECAETTATTAAGELSKEAAGELQPGDTYLEGPYLVFTAQFHLRRGYCCNSGCRHCPYR